MASADLRGRVRVSVGVHVHVGDDVVPGRVGVRVRVGVGVVVREGVGGGCVDSHGGAGTSMGAVPLMAGGGPPLGPAAFTRPQPPERRMGVPKVGVGGPLVPAAARAQARSRPRARRGPAPETLSDPWPPEWRRLAEGEASP